MAKSAQWQQVGNIKSDRSDFPMDENPQENLISMDFPMGFHMDFHMDFPQVFIKSPRGFQENTEAMALLAEADARGSLGTGTVNAAPGHPATAT